MRCPRNMIWQRLSGHNLMAASSQASEFSSSFEKQSDSEIANLSQQAHKQRLPWKPRAKRGAG